MDKTVHRGGAPFSGGVGAKMAESSICPLTTSRPYLAPSPRAIQGAYELVAGLDAKIVYPSMR